MIVKIIFTKQRNGNNIYLQWRDSEAKPKVWELFSNFTIEKI